MRRLDLSGSLQVSPRFAEPDQLGDHGVLGLGLEAAQGQADHGADPHTGGPLEPDSAKHLVEPGGLVGVGDGEAVAVLRDRPVRVGVLDARHGATLARLSAAGVTRAYEITHPEVCYTMPVGKCMEVYKMTTRSPLAAAAALAAGLLIAACGAAPAGQHGGGAPKSSPTPSATAKPLSAVAAAEQGFKAWGKASVLLTGPMPTASRPAAARDILVLGRAFALPGWRTSLGKGLVLVETPPGCQASWDHVAGSFVVSGPGGVAEVALVVHEFGACLTEAGGVKYVTNSASGPGSTAPWVLLGSAVALPPVAGLPGLPAQVWTPTVVATCTTGWVEGAGAQLPGGAVPGC